MLFDLILITIDIILLTIMSNTMIYLYLNLALTIFYHLPLEHHSDVMLDIQELAPDFIRLATAFKISPAATRSIEYQHRNSSPWNALNDVVTEWLKWNCDREKGNPNRRWLVNAVKSVDKELGLRLEAKYTVSKQS